MSRLDTKNSLTPKHKLIVPSTLLASATHIQTDKDTKIHAQTTEINYELFKIAQQKVIETNSLNQKQLVHA